MPDDGEGSLRMTYAQLAEARGITKRSAERLARARKWPRMRGNDGVAVVFVPPGGEQGSQQGSQQGGRPVVEPPTDREALREVVREAIESTAIADLQQRLNASEEERRRLTELLARRRGWRRWFR